MVPPSSHGVSRVPRYSGSCRLILFFTYAILTLSDHTSHCVRLKIFNTLCSPKPQKDCSLVWPLSLSLATTQKISVDFSSSPYLDVSVQAVPLIYLFYSVYDIQATLVWIAPFGNLRIKAYLPLPVAYRS